MTASLSHIGLETMGLDTPDETAAVTTVLELGYRHIDVVQIYRNEVVVGGTLAATDIPHEDMTLATRIWADSLAPVGVHRTTRESLEKLGTDSVDLSHVHRPIGTYDPEATLTTLDELVSDDLTRGVGANNFTATELDETLGLLDAPLVTHQTEYYPLFQRSKLLDHTGKRDYDMVTYSPLSGGRVHDVDEVIAVARRHGAMPEAVSLAWLAAKGLCPIPKALSECHLRVNPDAVSLELNAAGMAAIDSIESEVELFPE